MLFNRKPSGQCRSGFLAAISRRRTALLRVLFYYRFNGIPLSEYWRWSSVDNWHVHLQIEEAEFWMYHRPGNQAL